MERARHTTVAAFERSVGRLVIIGKDEVCVGDAVCDTGLEVHICFESRICPGDDGERGSNTEDRRVVKRRDADLKERKTGSSNRAL